MRVSQINLENGISRGPWSSGKETWIEIPDSDSYRVLNSEQSRQNYIQENGDVEVEYDTKYNVYRVPAFAQNRAEYSKVKQQWCNQYGCE
jgi:hypothetical protein